MKTHKELSRRYRELLARYENALSQYEILIHADTGGLLSVPKTSEYKELLEAEQDLDEFVMSLIARAAQ